VVVFGQGGLEIGKCCDTEDNAAKTQEGFIKWQKPSVRKASL